MAGKKITPQQESEILIDQLRSIASEIADLEYRSSNPKKRVLYKQVHKTLAYMVRLMEEAERVQVTETIVK